MKCLNCNSEIKNADKYCGICGTPNPNFTGTAEGDSTTKLIKDNPEATQTPLPVAPLQSPNIEPQPQEKGREQSKEKPQKEKRTAPLWLCILCIIIIFILSVACGALIQIHFGGELSIMNFAERILKW